MATPVYTTDLTDILAGAGTATGWTALGGGASGIAAETDYFIQGTGCTSKSAFANSTRGMIYNNGSGVTIPTDGAVLMWQTHQTSNSLDTQVNGGWQALIGSSSTAYYQFYVAGSDTIVYDDRWRCLAINPTVTPSATTGSPTATRQWFGILNKMVGGPTKGAPQACDAIRFGRVQYDYTEGDIANGYATFSGAATFNDDITRRYGQIQFSKGTYFIQGLHNLGTATAAVDFRDSNKTLNIINTEFVTSAFNAIVINNASSNVELTGITISALGTTSKGNFTVNNNATVNIISCTFADMNTFVFGGTNSTIINTSFNRCNTVTGNNSSFIGCVFNSSTVAADTSAIVWNTANDTDGKLDDTTFIKGASAHHAIELGVTSPTNITLRGVTSEGFNATNGQNDSTIHVKRTTGTVTINLVGTSGNFSYKSDGATVVLIIDPVTLIINCQDVSGNNIQDVRVLVTAAAGGSYAFQDSVTITRSGTTASVAHTAHGMSNGDKVLIYGASQNEYNGIKIISNVTVNAYDFTVSGTPTTPATGTITSTSVLISGLTDSNGIITDTRTYSLNQPIGGRARKSSSAPFYKTGIITGTINNLSGASITITMLNDE
jgi:hypothetical protein